MASSDILKRGFRAVLVRSDAARYAACVVLACAAAVVVAVPVFAQTVTVALVGAGDIANCTHNNDEATAQLLGSSLRSLTPDGTLPPLSQARVIALGDNAYPSGTRGEAPHQDPLQQQRRRGAQRAQPSLRALGPNRSERQSRSGQGHPYDHSWNRWRARQPTERDATSH